MTTHYIRYHRETSDNGIQSVPGNFEAWAEFRPKQPNWRPPVKPGDIVWVLSGAERRTGGKSYKLAYYFVAEQAPQLNGSRFYIRGNRGAFLENKGLIQTAPWFEAFFESIGRGGTSFQPVQSTYLPYFLDLLNQRTKKDRLQSLADEVHTSNLDDAFTLKAITSRRGQADFRSRLLQAYGNRCAVTGCPVEDILEAAHIVPHADENDYATNNGLLLRADIHTLFDLHLLGVDDFGRVVLAKRLHKTEYGKLHGAKLAPPEKLSDRPSALGLARRLRKLKDLEELEQS